jgi:hypothetical protein
MRALDAAALRLAYGALMVACAVAALARPPQAGAAGSTGAELPPTWDGRALRPLAPGDVERRFAARFPGTLARLSDGSRDIVWRHVEEPTRMLHPAADCYRGAGWRVAGERVEVDARQREWRCFDATGRGPGARRLRVCERITDADGRAYTDPSSWFWAALLGRSAGPWQAITTAQAIQE